MKRFVAASIVAASVAVFALPAGAADVADTQGFCKKQGSSSCAGQSECSTAHQPALPAGQQKKC
jgi:hypothetical protein